MSYTHASRHVRRGVTSLQAVLVMGALTLAVVAGLRLVGQNTTTELDRTAVNVADPTTLVDRWGSCTEQ
ncbi:MAG: hypothetical protein MUF48_13750 [Pirellulaceae bacterium]|nr:hypothetical protein [Pirellulaceae bacterium]